MELDFGLILVLLLKLYQLLVSLGLVLQLGVVKLVVSIVDLPHLHVLLLCKDALSSVLLF